MDQRIESILKLIDNRSKGVCDVGTDHGFLPIRLASEGFNGEIIATDINILPLKRAEENAVSNNVRDRISFCRYDGLPEHLSDSFDTAVIAGMGSDLICSVIDRADWILSDKYTIILQPMTKPEVLRYYLVNNGFSISADILAEDRGRIYQIIKCCFTSVNDSYSDLELFAGKESRCNDLELYSRLLGKIKKNIKVILDASSDSGDFSKLEFYKNIIKEIKI